MIKLRKNYSLDRTPFARHYKDEPLYDGPISRTKDGTDLYVLRKAESFVSFVHECVKDGLEHRFATQTHSSTILTRTNNTWPTKEEMAGPEGLARFGFELTSENFALEPSGPWPARVSRMRLFGLESSSVATPWCLKNCPICRDRSMLERLAAS